MNPLRIGLDILKTYVSEKTGSVLMQLGDIHSETVDSDEVELWQQVCFVSRPSEADKGAGACQAVVMDRGGRLAVIATRDMRGQDLAGNLKPGEFCVYAPGLDGKSQGRILGNTDGSLSLFTTDTNKADGTSVYFRIAPDGFRFVAPWGSIIFDATGFHVKHSSGASFDLGGIYGMPSPLDKISSYIAMKAGVFKTSSSAQSFGVGVPKPLADSVATAQAIAGLQAQITALATAIAAITAGATNGGTAALASQVTAIANGVTAVSTAVALIPATTSST